MTIHIEIPDQIAQAIRLPAGEQNNMPLNWHP